MGNRFQVTCINKPNRDSPLEHITHVGGFGTSHWKLTVEEVIRRIETPGGERFFVRAGGYETDVEVVSPSGRRKYIKTTPDGTKKRQPTEPSGVSLIGRSALAVGEKPGLYKPGFL
jgi:Protein of unknown function (DUF3892)